MNSSPTNTEQSPNTWREQLYIIIFEADTPMGKAFDVGLIVVILLSIMAVMLESVSSIRADYGWILYNLEWVFTVLFTIEYILRLTTTTRPVDINYSQPAVLQFIWGFFRNPNQPSNVPMSSSLNSASG